MRLKIAAIGMMIADIILFITSGYCLARVPAKTAPRAEQVSFLIRTYAVVVVLLLSLVVTVVLVWIWMHNLREEYRQQARENMESLIEGTLRDHGSKQS